jgi:hypothetical protein
VEHFRGFELCMVEIDSYMRILLLTHARISKSTALECSTACVHYAFKNRIGHSKLCLSLDLCYKYVTVCQIKALILSCLREVFNNLPGAYSSECD